LAYRRQSHKLSAVSFGPVGEMMSKDTAEVAISVYVIIVVNCPNMDR